MPRLVSSRKAEGPEIVKGLEALVETAEDRVVVAAPVVKKWTA